MRVILHHQTVHKWHPAQVNITSDSFFVACFYSTFMLYSIYYKCF